MRKPCVAILGFGLMGRLCALELYKETELSIYEKGSLTGEQSAGFVAAAMLAPLAESVACERDLSEQGLAAISLWQKVISQLDKPVFFQQQGSLVVAHAQDKGDLHSFGQRIKSIEQHQAITVTKHEIGQLEPELAGRFQQGFYLPCEGQLDNRQFYEASFAQLQGTDVSFYENCDAQPNLSRFDCVLDCRGLGAKNVLAQLRGVRGEVIRLHAPEVNLKRPIRLMHPRYPIYIVPKPNHEFVIGATEIESQSMRSMTLRSAMELLSAAYTVHSGFAEAEIIEMSAGLRPSLPDNRPVINCDGNVVRINGLYRHGYLLAPIYAAKAVAIAKQVCEKKNEINC